MSMPEPKFFIYGTGPFNLETDSMVRIADALDELKCMLVLTEFDIDLIRIIKQDRFGRREPYTESLYYFVARKTENEEPKRYFRLGQVIMLCGMLVAELITPEDLFYFQVGRKEIPTASNGETVNPDASSDNQEQNATEQP